jgi:hypothetical protein
MAIAASGQKNDLLHRIEKILGIEKRKNPDFKKLGGLLAGLICVIALNALFFFSSPVIKNHSLTFTAIANPFYQLVADGKEFTVTNDKPAGHKKKEVYAVSVKKTNSTSVAHKKTAETCTEVNVAPETHFVTSKPEMVNGFAQVDQRMHLEQKLKKCEVEQVKGVVAATKKVLEQGQWKQIEKNVADALTQSEKEDLKEKYLTEVEKVNWQKLENKLRQSYNQINWPRVTAQLSTAITNIKLDSLTTVYNLALTGLNEAQTWMDENNVESIPDTDLKLEEIKVHKEQLEKQLETIKAIKTRKIIHL